MEKDHDRVDLQPGFGPREIDPPAVTGYEPDLAKTRDELVAEQRVTDTMEAADLRGDESDDVPQDSAG